VRRFAVLALAALALLLGGCGGGLLGDPRTAPTEADELRRQNVELRRDKTVAEVELARLRQEVARLEAGLAAIREELARAAPPAGSGTAPGAAGPRLTPAPPAVEEEDLADEELVPPPAPPTPVPAPPAPASPVPASPVPAPAPAARAVDAAARALYDESYALFHEERYAESEAGFERFLELYPRTDLADNAQFWIGECRFARGEHERALEAFMRTVEAYPEGNKVPDALLKAGRCLERMGEGAAAAATYEEIVSRFGASAAAVAARERLAELE
jgi:tol-pal system protein YbgF